MAAGPGWWFTVTSGFLPTGASLSISKWRLREIGLLGEFSVMSGESSRGNVSGYYRNLGSLRAGTRHDGGRPARCLLHEAGSVSDSDIIVACTAFYTASQLVSICMQCAYFATIGQSFDWREPIGLQERLEGRSSHNGEFSVMSRSRSQGTKVTIVTGDVSHCTRKQSGRRAHCAFTRHVSTSAKVRAADGAQRRILFSN